MDIVKTCTLYFNYIPPVTPCVNYIDLQLVKFIWLLYFLFKQVLEFVDEHGNEVLNLGSFTLLPQHVVRLILAREELRADEFTKFQVSITLNSN